LFQRAGDRDRSPVVLGDTDLFFFYLRGGKLEAEAERVIREVNSGRIQLRTSSEIYDDAISAIRADNAPLSLAHSFISDMKSIPHAALPMGAEIAEEGLALYIRMGGRRKLSYFDSFHVATAARYALPLLTSDRFMIENSSALRVKTIDLSRWK